MMGRSGPATALLEGPPGPDAYRGGRVANALRACSDVLDTLTPREAHRLGLAIAILYSVPPDPQRSTQERKDPDSHG